MKIAISAESTIDLTKEMIDKYDVKVIPFSVLLGERLELDGEIDCDQIIEFVNSNKVLPKTSAVNECQYEEYFESLLKDYDAIVHFSLSSELSSACGNAINASKKFENVYVVDTKTLSSGIGLLALYGRKLADDGLDAKTVYEKCLERVPFVQASFELKRVDYLYKGGRCSAMMYLGANLLRIHPQIILKNGKMVSGKKYRGNFEHVVSSYVDDTLQEFNNPDLEQVFITYTTAEDKILESVKAKLCKQGFKNVFVTRAGATITSHCGEHCLGILYINDGGKTNEKNK